MSSTVLSWLLLGKPDLGMTLNGCLAGLVAITAPCAFVGVGSSLIIGFIAGGLVVLSVIMFDRLKIDDPVGALSVHLVNGVFGTLAVGLFAQDKITGTATGNGLFYGGGWTLFLAQLAGTFGVAIYTVAISLIAWAVLKATLGIRVSLQEEIHGLDVGEHGNAAYPEFLSRKPAYSFLGINNGR
jgi:Amt family ammonium transporter